MAPKTKSLIGAWQTEDEDSHVIFIVRRDGNTFSVQVFDKVDGEEFIVSNVRLRKDRLLFETQVKSSGFRAKHILTALSNRRVLQELTVYERWKKIPMLELKRFQERLT